MKTVVAAVAAGIFFASPPLLRGQALDEAAPEDASLSPQASLALSAIGSDRSSWRGLPELASFGSDFENIESELPTLPPGFRSAAVRTAASSLGSDIRSAEASSSQIPETLQQDMADLDNAVGNWQDARGFARQIIARNPKSSSAWLSASQADLGLGRPRQALVSAQRSAALSPKNSAAWRNEALAFAAMGNRRAAENAARRALSIDPSNKAAAALLGLLSQKNARFHLGKITVAWDTPSAGFLTAGSGRGAVTAGSASALPRQGAGASAMRPPRAGSALSRASGLLQDAAGKIAVADYSSALSDAVKAAELDPKNPAAYYYQAAADNMRGRYRSAIANASRGLAVNPAYILLRDERGWAFNRLGRARDAIADANASLESDPRDAYAYANLSRADEQEGNIRSALADLRQASAINPDFIPPYHEALQRYGLIPAPSRKESAPALWQDGRSLAFLMVLTCSLAGGLLVGAGILRLIRPDGAAAPVAAQGGVSWPAPEGISLEAALDFPSLGEAYAGWDKALEREVGVKPLFGVSGFPASERRRILSDVRALSDIHHPALIKIYSVAENKGQVFLVFEALKGRPLGEILREKGALRPAQIRGIMDELGGALREALARGVGYPYLKAENILLSRDGTVKILDFGLASSSAGPGLNRETSPGALGSAVPAPQGAAEREKEAVAALALCFLEISGYGRGAEAVAWAHDAAERYATLNSFLQALDSRTAQRAAA
ncbi:MAG: protein kinase [Elusimicrobia bacterium]|nr:protein kinase [Elusimicrobiota bacterium]